MSKTKEKQVLKTMPMKKDDGSSTNSNTRVSFFVSHYMRKSCQCLIKRIHMDLLLMAYHWVQKCSWDHKIVHVYHHKLWIYCHQVWWFQLRMAATWTVVSHPRGSCRHTYDAACPVLGMFSLDVPWTPVLLPHLTTLDHCTHPQLLKQSKNDSVWNFNSYHENLLA